MKQFSLIALLIIGIAVQVQLSRATELPVEDVPVPVSEPELEDDVTQAEPDDVPGPDETVVTADAVNELVPFTVPVNPQNPAKCVVLGNSLECQCKNEVLVDVSKVNVEVRLPQGSKYFNGCRKNGSKLFCLKRKVVNTKLNLVKSLFGVNRSGSFYGSRYWGSGRNDRTNQPKKDQRTHSKSRGDRVFKY